MNLLVHTIRLDQQSVRFSVKIFLAIAHFQLLQFFLVYKFTIIRISAT
jgi:hypothetical protein